ncbi:hypothetical protein BaRGS_00014696 [Batillaria attramentaria]|uniref:Uncharacterized protein n=1 Tax=Batillaria attramentaria TaxID=370345 RepID=A0ABD0L406_9CAEN
MNKRANEVDQLFQRKGNRPSDNFPPLTLPVVFPQPMRGEAEPVGPGPRPNKNSRRTKQYLPAESTQLFSRHLSNQFPVSDGLKEIAAADWWKMREKA